MLPVFFNNASPVWNLIRDWEAERENTPRYDVEENEGSFLVHVELPGVPKDKVSVDVKNNELSVKGEKAQRTFQFTASLPEGVDAGKIEADYQNGVLSIALPKAEGTKARRIPIGEGQTSFFAKLAGKKVAAA